MHIALRFNHVYTRALKLVNRVYSDAHPCISPVLIYLDVKTEIERAPAASMRSRRLGSLLVLCILVSCTVLLLRNSASNPNLTAPPDRPTNPIPKQQPPLQAVQHASHDSHPVLQLIDHAAQEEEEILSRQSATLDDAVKEYKRRYKLNPPPNFDKWYYMAKERGVQMIDEYDTVFHSLLPFWSLPPSVIRSRARESLGFDNSLMGISIRNGQFANVNGAEQWQQKSTMGMMKSFMKYLPDMDLAFNIHDEPRVVVPHDDLIRLVNFATDVAIPRAAMEQKPQNLWSVRPADVNDGRSMPDVRTTRFNRFAHQPIWTESRMSCPPDSPARSLSDTPKDDIGIYSFSDLGLVNNKTAFSDICNSPSLKETFGFFDRPNAFNVAHDLFPIFSQSKVSSYQDILYPSPWYWAGKVPYRASKDYKWSDKANVMWWRGSTTGGFSRDGGWRRQHRQRVVRAVNSHDRTYILENTTESGPKTLWQMREVLKSDYRSLFDVHFSHVGQCDPGDCDAQREFFDIAKTAAQEDAWRYKYLLDMDGNAFSGRFYAFLKSQSLIFKMAIFREWHEEWIKPWAHYVPLSLNCSEYFEVMRYFDREQEGQEQAYRVAMAGRDWAHKILRNDDFEVWFFRLLLEYGRIVDDNRDHLGYTTTTN